MLTFEGIKKWRSLQYKRAKNGFKNDARGPQFHKCTFQKTSIKYYFLDFPGLNTLFRESVSLKDFFFALLRLNGI